MWLAFFLYDILVRFAGIASLKNDEHLQKNVKRKQKNYETISGNMPGMVNGTGGLILMMALPLVRMKMKNVKLIRLRKAGRYYQKQAIPIE